MFSLFICWSAAPVPPYTFFGRSLSELVLIETTRTPPTYRASTFKCQFTRSSAILLSFKNTKIYGNTLFPIHYIIIGYHCYKRWTTTKISLRYYKERVELTLTLKPQETRSSHPTRAQVQPCSWNYIIDTSL
jgi:hypothetical protein